MEFISNQDSPWCGAVICISRQPSDRRDLAEVGEEIVGEAVREVVEVGQVDALETTPRETLPVACPAHGCAPYDARHD